MIFYPRKLFAAGAWFGQATDLEQGDKASIKSNQIKFHIMDEKPDMNYELTNPSAPILPLPETLNTTSISQFSAPLWSLVHTQPAENKQNLF